MEKLPMCRICLVKNVRMYKVVNKYLHELYEKLTDVPFVTEDSKPMLACFFCCTKLKQCWRFQRKCLDAEEMFAQMMNGSCEKDPLLNSEHFEVFNGFIKSSVVHISIDNLSQTESKAIKKELPDVWERHDNIIDPELHQTYEIKVENMDNSYLDVKHTPAYLSDSDSEDMPLIKIKTEKDNEQEYIVSEQENVDNSYDLNYTPAPYSESDSGDVEPVMQIKIEVEDEEESLELEMDNVDKSYADINDSPAHHSKSNTEEDKTVMELKTEVEDEKESIGAPVVKKLKQDTRRAKLEDTISVRPKKIKQKDSRKLFASKIIRQTQNRTSNLVTELKEPIATSKQGVNNRINTSALVTNKRNNSDIDDIRGKTSNKGNDDMNGYLRVYVKEKPFKCDICQRSFRYKSTLTSHIRIHTDDKPFKCDICRSNFTQKGNLTSHLRVHSGEKPFKCDICQRGFSKKTSLTCHIRVHAGEKPYKCDICQRSFSQKSHLTYHNIRVHAPEKHFICDICHCSFSTKFHLTRHIRVHTDEKPLKCNICQSSFNTKFHLTRHIRVHTGEKPFKCDTCQRSFSQNSTLTRHSYTCGKQLKLNKMMLTEFK